LHAKIEGGRILFLAFALAFLIFAIYQVVTLTKQEHIDYWKKMAEDDWLAVKGLFQMNIYHYLVHLINKYHLNHYLILAMEI
jgi:hypothetical protein